MLQVCQKRVEHLLPTCQNAHETPEKTESRAESRGSRVGPGDQKSGGGEPGDEVEARQ